MNFWMKTLEKIPVRMEFRIPIGARSCLELKKLDENQWNYFGVEHKEIKYRSTLYSEGKPVFLR